jgi:ribosome-binding factor A
MIEHHNVNQYGYASGRIDFPFEVEKGKIKYIGELNFTEDESFEANNKSERDLIKLKEMFPSLTIEK